jgi:hypothetical protein
MFSNAPNTYNENFKEVTYPSPLFDVFGYKSLSHDTVPCVAVLDSGISGCGVVDVENTVKIEP